MRDLSLHILDIAENSIRAEAKDIKISIIENGILKCSIRDNGKGMDEETMKMALDPFFTTKSERKKKIGLGLPLLKQNAEMCDGFFKIESVKDSGTTVSWSINKHHIDALPLGDIAETIWSLMTFNEDRNIIYTHSVKNRDIVIDSRDIKDVFAGLPLKDPEVYMAIRSYIIEQISNLKNQEDLK